MSIKRSKIRESARGEQCSLRIPGVCNFNRETTVLAHLNCVDKGMGFKSPAWWAVDACSGCHDYIDGRANQLGPHDTPFGFKWKEEYILAGLYETQKKLREKGLIK